MNFYDFLITTYNNFVSVFPGPLQWLVTLMILVGVIAAVVVLARHHILFLILLIILIPFTIPVIISLLSDIGHFILTLLSFLHLTSPPAST